MHLKELVEMLPDAWYPLHDAAVGRTSTLGGSTTTVPGAAADTSSDLGVSEATSEVACEEAVDGLHVVGTEHPAEVVM